MGASGGGLPSTLTSTRFTSATAAWLGISWPTELTRLWSTAVCMLITTWGCFCHRSNRWVVYASTLITSQGALCHCGKRWVVCASSVYMDYHSGLSNGWMVYASNRSLGALYFTSAMGEWSMPLTDHLRRFISLQQWVSGLCRYTDHHVGPYMSLQLQAMPVRWQQLRAFCVTAATNELTCWFFLCS